MTILGYHVTELDKLSTLVLPLIAYALWLKHQIVRDDAIEAAKREQNAHPAE
jgi:hypothetical protein